MPHSLICKMLFATFAMSFSTALSYVNLLRVGLSNSRPLNIRSCAQGKSRAGFMELGQRQAKTLIAQEERRRHVEGAAPPLSEVPPGRLRGC